MDVQETLWYGILRKAKSGKVAYAVRVMESHIWWHWDSSLRNLPKATIVAMAWYRREAVLSLKSTNQGNVKRVWWHCSVSTWAGWIHFSEFLFLQVSFQVGHKGHFYRKYEKQKWGHFIFYTCKVGAGAFIACICCCLYAVSTHCMQSFSLPVDFSSPSLLGQVCIYFADERCQLLFKDTYFIKVGF